MSALIGLVPDLKCGCGRPIDKGYECWQCGEVVCQNCARIRNIDEYEAIYCPFCAPEEARKDDC